MTSSSTMLRLINNLFNDDFLESFENQGLVFSNKYITGNHLVIYFLTWSERLGRTIRITVIVSLLDSGHVTIEIYSNRENLKAVQDSQKVLKQLTLEMKERIEEALHQSSKWRMSVLTGAIQVIIKQKEPL